MAFAYGTIVRRKQKFNLKTYFNQKELQRLDYLVNYSVKCWNIFIILYLLLFLTICYELAAS